MPTPSHVLVVDDDRTTCSTYRTILRLAGYKVTVAESGCAGLEILQSASCDVELALVDERMPDLSGLEFWPLLGSWCHECRSSS